MRFLELAETSRALAATRSRKEKTARLAALLRAATPAELPVVVAYLSGELPQGKIGVGWAGLSSVRALAPAIEASLDVLDVHRAFDELAALAGAGSAAARRRVLTALFERATADERELLRAVLTGELRQGGAEGVMVEAIALAFDAPAAAVRRAFMMAGDLPAVALALADAGVTALARFALVPFRPILPMLAEPADDAAEALAELGPCSLEWKLDGARVQAHKDGDEVRVYTRGLLDVTANVPEVVELVRAMPARRLVLDGEAIALHPDGRPRPFQITMGRFSTRQNVEAARAALPLSVFFFDCMLRDEDAMTDAPLVDRLAALSEVVPAASRVVRITTAEPAVATQFYEDALAQGHEGAMVKALSSPYEAGARGGAWRKLKRAHTLDLVILAVEWGSGRRKGMLSNVHLGARDGGGWVMLGKTFKGMTDEMLAFQTERLLALETGRDGHVVHVRPELVAEVAFQDVQVSPRYPGGMALRLARIVRYRPDKGPADASSIDQVRALLPRDAPDDAT